MNKTQKKILIIGILLILGCGIFPPWTQSFQYKGFKNETSAGYGLITSPPKGKNNLWGIHLDVSRLLIQVAGLTIGFGTLIFIKKDND